MSNNKSVVITGVLGGIGQALAKVFKDAGYRVIGLDIKEQENECDIFFRFDLNAYCDDFRYRASQNEKFHREISRVDVLINNAAVQLLGSIPDINLADWNETLNVNLTGPLFLSQYFFQKLEKWNGSIINIASIHQQLTKKRFVAYATSKSALVGLTKAMSVDLQGKVRVNCISPAAIDTPMLLNGFNNSIEKVDELNKLHPLQRIGRPEEVAQLALLLAESKVGFINGANITIDGGIGNVLKDLD